MTGRLSGKTALITAAAQGIGRSTTEMFAAEGATVFATDINQEKLAELDGVPGITPHQLDFTNLTQIADVADRMGPIDILVSCTGFVHNGSILDCDESDFDFSIDLNLGGAYRMIRSVLPGMIGNGGGSIVNIASAVSSIKGAPNRFIYGTSKAGLIGLTKSVAADFIGDNIRCNAVCPGTVQSPSLDDRINGLPDPIEARKAFIARQPMGRLGTTDEIAAMCVYLGSDESAFVTGSEFVIDGGMTI